MDAITYLKEKSRLTNGCKINCAECKLGMEEEYDCEDFENAHPEKVIAIIEQWAKDCPEETVLDDFKKNYPQALLDGDGTPLQSCPFRLNPKYKECREFANICKACWNQPAIK